MKVVVAAVMSIDGKLTKRNDPDLRGWVSHEDRGHFRSLLDQHDAIAIGRETYDLINGKLTLEPGKLRIVLTSTPEKHNEEEVEGQLTFRNNTPKELVSFLESKNYQNLLVTGGERMITEFLQAKLVDEMYITIEPRIFGNGVRLIAPADLDIKLELIENLSLNQRGTILLKYRVK